MFNGSLSQITKGLGVLLLTTAMVYGGEGIPRDAWPDEWFEEPRTASQMKVKDFKESPILSEQVKKGELPPVEERLPDDPIVITPFEEIGRYGGTIRTFDAETELINNVEPPLIMGPAVSKILPHLARDWEYSNGGKTFTLYLRKGIKWSDGEPHTADDYMFWYKHILCNEKLTPVKPPMYKNLELKKLGKYIVQFRFSRPTPFLVKRLAHGIPAVPAHFLEQYHPAFVSEEKLKARVKKEGYMNWMGMFRAASANSGMQMWETPTLKAFVVSKKSPTIWRYVRNPYYPKVDPEGKQLPYIDKIEAYKVNNPEVKAAKASTGQVDFAASSLETQDIPLFKLGERAESYRTLIWNRLHGTDVVIQPNLTNPDEQLREIFQDVRFRKALSLAINREELNRIIYFGQGAPRQTTVIPSSKFYEPEFASAYTEYNPEQARKLLNEMGMKDVDGDGKREAPDGQNLGITLEWMAIETPKQLTMELVREHWRNVGMDIDLKQINNNLQRSRAQGNVMDMTVWHADRTSDILFPPEPFWFVPMHSNWEECHWPLWANWYLTDGEQGEKPPPKIMNLLDWWTEMRTTMDEERRIELGKKILRSQAENLWTIGTIGLAPQPVVVSDRLRNVPGKGYFGWDNRWTMPYKPYTWYLTKQYK